MTVEGSGGSATGGGTGTGAGSTGAASTGGAGGSGNATSGGSSAGGSGAAGGFGGAGGTVFCNPSEVFCDGPIPFCPPGEVPAVENGCWGDCVPILECATEPNCDNCQGGFCAEYVAFTVEYRCVMPSLMCSALACSCMAPYFCASPFDACVEMPMDGLVSCECTSC